jgi:hypothetical protein
MSEELIKGRVPEALISPEPMVNKVLEGIAQARQLPEIDTYITAEDVAKGFKRWKETTSTSPSGCHLGLRRLPAVPFNNKDLDKLRASILAVQTHIINIPLYLGFSPKRWQVVINAMLEKTPGTPLLHKL